MAPKRKNVAVNNTEGTKRRTTASASTSSGSILPFNFPDEQAHSDVYDYLKNRAFEDARTIDWEVVKEYGFEDDINKMITGWERFFGIKEKGYKELTLEFLSSFTFNKRKMSWDDSEAIKFRLFNEWRYASLTEFVIQCGFYTTEYTSIEEYRGSLTDDHYIPDRELSSFWSEIVNNNSPYIPRKSKSTSLKSPVMRYIHRVLAHSICGRGESQGVVGKKDLLFMYCMDKGKTVHLGYHFACYITSVAKKKTGVIMCGPYITHLARNIGANSLRQFHLTKVCEMLTVDSKTVKAMGIAVQQPIEHGIESSNNNNVDVPPLPPRQDETVSQIASMLERLEKRLEAWQKRLDSVQHGNISSSEPVQVGPPTCPDDVEAETGVAGDEGSNRKQMMPVVENLDTDTTEVAEMLVQLSRDISGAS